VLGRNLTINRECFFRYGKLRRPQLEGDDAAVIVAADIIAYMEELFPQSLAEEWDNVGLQVGSASSPCRTVMTCLTVTEAAAEYAAETSVDLIISHHPLIFAPLKRVTLDNSVGRIIYSLVTHRISLFVGHTNIDRAEGGLNDWLAESLHLLDVGVLEPELDESGYGRIGRLQSKMTLASLAKYVGEVLGIQGVRIVGPNDRLVQAVAVCSGSGSHLWPAALAQGADVLITGDVKYHTALDVSSTSLAMIDAGHFGTEAVFASRLADLLEEEGKRRQWPLRVIAYEAETDPMAAV
jgi:dinuclear metal center YbgI/SA1388 family protein